MSLKKIVNDKESWDALVEFYDECIADQHKIMERVTDVTDVHRSQGAIAVLRKLKYMRDKVNGPR